MPNKIEKLPDGNFHVELETGERFDGDALAVTEAMANAHVSTKRWGQEWKAKAEAAPVTTQPAAQPAGPQPTAEETQLQTYLLDQHAKALGYKNGEEYKAELTRVRQVTETSYNQSIAGDFLQACPDFPNSPEAIEKLSGAIEQAGWDFSPQSMIAAHALLTREHAQDQTKGYAPLSMDQQQQTLVTEAKYRETRAAAAPPMIRSGSPDASQQGFNPWDTKNVKLDDLRSMAIRQELEGRQR